MNKVFLVYKTDEHHSYASRELIGIGTSKEDAILIIVEYTHHFAGNITQELLEQLRTIKQTQGFNDVGEFQYEEVKTNTFLGL